MREGSTILLAGIAIVLVFSLCAILLLIAPVLFPTYDFDNRISLAELALTAASLVAILLAAWEFAQAQRKPKLRLWMEPWLGGDNYGIPTQVHSNARGFYPFGFNLLLENYGEAPARFIKIMIELKVEAVLDGNAEISLTRRRRAEPGAGSWHPPAINAYTNLPSRWHTFHGGDEFVSYNHRKTTDELRPWLDQLGYFGLDIKNAPGLMAMGPNQELPIKIVYSLYADGFSKHNQELKFISLSGKA